MLMLIVNKLPKKMPTKKMYKFKMDFGCLNRIFPHCCIVHQIFFCLAFYVFGTTNQIKLMITFVQHRDSVREVHKYSFKLMFFFSFDAFRSITSISECCCYRSICRHLYVKLYIHLAKILRFFSAVPLSGKLYHIISSNIT